MTGEEYKEKLTEYINRNNFWTEKTVNQLGYSINLFTTVGIALLGYLVTNRNKFPKLEVSCEAEFNLILTIYITTIISIILSIGYGFKSILCRLFDFRVTRHLALSRKRYLSRNKDNSINKNRSKGLIDSKTIDISELKHFPVFWKHLFGKIDFINESDFSNDNIVQKFDKLRKESKILGNTTWKCHRWQIALFLFAVVTYGLTILR